ncbi:MAG: hypothetical protein MJE68_19905 [Proteobacteria bacterium]|nr:hypothetical protein [Pseudomonadota bacterium]
MPPPPPSTITLASPAKVNLSLRVEGRRQDGFHTLDSLVSFAGLSDQIILRLSDKDSLTWRGIPPPTTTPQPTSLSRARDAFRQVTGWQHPLAITITKNIPLAAGLGGGSGNAAAVLVGMEGLSQMRFPQDRAIQAMQLGADVPLQLTQLNTIYNTNDREAYSDTPSHREACLWRMQGIGETITPMPFTAIAGSNIADSNLHKNMGVLLVNPNIQLATAAVFAEYAKHATRHSQNTPRTSFALGDNDLEAAACRLAPPLAECLSHLRQLSKTQGGIACGMSGSGASCFVLFPSPAHAGRAVQSAAGEWLASLWYWVGGLA